MKNEIEIKIRSTDKYSVIEGFNYVYIFFGKRVYAEYEPRRYMRLLARFAA